MWLNGSWCCIRSFCYLTTDVIYYAKDLGEIKNEFITSFKGSDLMASQKLKTVTQPHWPSFIILSTVVSGQDHLLCFATAVKQLQLHMEDITNSKLLFFRFPGYDWPPLFVFIRLWSDNQCLITVPSFIKMHWIALPFVSVEQTSSRTANNKNTQAFTVFMSHLPNCNEESITLPWYTSERRLNTSKPFVM